MLLLRRSSGLLQMGHSIWSWSWSWVPIAHLLIDSGPRLQLPSSPLWWFQPWPNLVVLYRVRQPLPSALCPLPGLCAAAAMSSRPPSASLLLSVQGRVAAWARECVQVVGAPPSPAHPTERHQTWHGDCVATHVCSSRYGGLPCIRPSPLYPRTVPKARQAHSSIRAARRRCARPKRKEHYRKPGLSRGHPCSLFVPSPSAPATPFLTLLQAACCTLQHLALAPALAPPTPCTLHPAPAPTLQPNAAFRIAAPCPSRRHYPRSWHASTLQVRTPARYRSTARPVWRLCLDMGPGPWTEPGRARPSPLRDNHDLPCLSAMLIDFPVRPRPGATSWPPSHRPSTVDCDDHPPLGGAGHLDAGTQPTNCCPP